MARVLVVSPHPDDEAIGCGGTLRRHADNGDEVAVIFLTSGEAGGHGLVDSGAVREQEAAAAAAILGVARFDFWREGDGRLRATSSLVSRLSNEVTAWRPEVVYVPHSGEMHRDHRATYRSARRALDHASAQGVSPKVLMFEVWTPMREMDEIVDISDYIDAKIAAIRAYSSQCKIQRFDEAFLGLSRYRGEMHSWPGGAYAEIFRRLNSRRGERDRGPTPP